MPQVAVVIPAYNPGKYLVESVHSVLAQTFTSFELVVVDDGSEPDAFPELPEDGRFRIVRQINQGVSVARNRGVEETTAPLVAFLDADDHWLPQKLEWQLSALSDCPEAVVCYSQFRHIDPAGQVVSDGDARRIRWHRDLLAGCPIPLSSAIVRRRAFCSARRFDPAYAIVADWDLWLRLIDLGPFVFVDEPLVEYRVAPHNRGQMSGDPWKAHLESTSVLDRQELRALRSNDPETRRHVDAGRSAMRRMRSEQAAFRFADSLGAQAEWNMLSTAVRIHPAAGVKGVVRRLRHRARNAMRPIVRSTR